MVLVKGLIFVLLGTLQLSCQSKLEVETSTAQEGAEADSDDKPDIAKVVEEVKRTVGTQIPEDGKVTAGATVALSFTSPGPIDGFDVYYAVGTNGEVDCSAEDFTDGGRWKKITTSSLRNLSTVDNKLTFDWQLPEETGALKICTALQTKDSYGNSTIVRAAGPRNLEVIAAPIENTPPTIALTAPAATGANVTATSIFNVTFTAEDVEDEASISLYNHTLTTGCEDDPATNGWTLLSDTLKEGTDTSYDFDTTGLDSTEQYFCAMIDDGTNDKVYAVSSGSLAIAPYGVPTLAITGPASGSQVGEAASVGIVYDAADVDDDATVDLFYRLASDTGCDAANISDWTSIATGLAEGSAVTHSWTVPTAPGTYHICGRITGDDQTFYVAAPASVAVNDAPTLAFTEPMDSDDSVLDGLSFAATFTAADSDSVATIDLFYRKGSSVGCDAAGIGDWISLATALAESATTHSFAAPDGAGSYSFCGRIQDGVNAPVYVLSDALTVAANAAPALAINEPADNNDIVAEGANFNVTYTGTDTDSVATVDLFYRLGSTADCNASGISNWTSIATGLAEGSNAIQAWTPPTVAGSYYVCGRITDEKQAIYQVSTSAVEINAAGSFTFTEPMGNDDSIIDGVAFNLGFTGSDADSVATIDLFYRKGSNASCDAADIGNWTSVATNLAESATAQSFTPPDADGSYYLCGRIKDGVNADTYNISEALAVTVNAAPTLTIDEPTGSDDTIVESASFDVVYTAADSDSTATVDLFTRFGSNAGCDATGISNWVSLASGLVEGTSATQTWTGSATAGAYHICGRTTDEKQTVYASGSSPVVVNDAPTITINSPGSSNITAVQGEAFSITFTATDSDDDATIDLYYKTLTGSCSGDPASNGWTAIATGLSEDSASSYSWDTSGLGLESYYFCARISDGTNANLYNETSGSLNLTLPFRGGVRQVAVGFDHTCALLDDFNVKCWGDGSFGKLGYGNTTDRGASAGTMEANLPTVDLGTGRTARKVTVGDSFSCALLDDASIKCWGKNDYGQLGRSGGGSAIGDQPGEMGNNLLIVPLGSGISPIDLVSGRYHSCALLNNNKIKCWGGNDFGQLGLGDSSTRGGSFGGMGDSLPFVDLGNGETVLKLVATSANHTCALLSNHQVKCWGSNTLGQLGIGNTNNRGDNSNEMGTNLAFVDLGSDRHALDVTVGGGQTCALLDNHQVKCWGWGAFGIAGQGDTDNKGDNSSEMGDNLSYINLGFNRTARKVVSLGLGNCAILDDNSLKCWGHNKHGQLGLGDDTHKGDEPNEMGNNLPAVDLGTGNKAVAVSGGQRHTCAILHDSSLKCWGLNYSGVLGLENSNSYGHAPNTMGDNLPHVKLGTGQMVSKIFTGISHNSCALINGTGLKCWGYNNKGQLGRGDTVQIGNGANDMGANLASIDLGTDRYATDVGIGYSFMCALLDNSSVRCWGQNNKGQLGLGDTDDRGDDSGEMGDNLPAVDLGTGRTAIGIAVGGSHACAMLDDGNVKCWGENGDGELGIGDTADRGNSSGEMGDNLPTIDFGIGRKVTSLYAYQYHTCAILDNSDMKCWGSGSQGKLGQGATTDIGTSSSQMGDNLTAINLGSNKTAVQVAQGQSHTCAMLQDRSIKCWGNGNSGQLGYENGDSQRTSSEINSLSTVNYGSSGRALKIAAGFSNSCVLLTSGEVKCWGYGSYGTAGQGHNNDIGDNSGEMGSSLGTADLGSGLRAVDLVSAGGKVCALLDDNSVKCWGAGGSGLGHAGQTSGIIGNGPNEMGDNLPITQLW